MSKKKFFELIMKLRMKIEDACFLRRIVLYVGIVLLLHIDMFYNDKARFFIFILSLAGILCSVTALIMEHS